MESVPALALPLLHVARVVVEPPTVREEALVAGAAAPAVTAVAIWRSPIVSTARRLARRRPCRRVASAFAGVLMALAVLPAILPYDHLVPRARTESGGHSTHDAAVHASHCHDTPGSCADAPVSAGPGQFLTSEPLIVVPALLVLATLSRATILTGITRRPDVPVPLPAHAA